MCSEVGGGRAQCLLNLVVKTIDYLLHAGAPAKNLPRRRPEAAKICQLPPGSTLRRRLSRDTLATDNLDEALAFFIEGACGLEAVGQAFDRYERALIEASELHALLQTTVIALRESSELIERYVWSPAPEETAQAQANNHRAIRALQAAHDNL